MFGQEDQFMNPLARGLWQYGSSGMPMPGSAPPSMTRGIAPASPVTPIAAPMPQPNPGVGLGAGTVANAGAGGGVGLGSGAVANAGVGDAMPPSVPSPAVSPPGSIPAPASMPLAGLNSAGQPMGGMPSGPPMSSAGLPSAASPATGIPSVATAMSMKQAGVPWGFGSMNTAGNPYGSIR